MPVIIALKKCNDCRAVKPLRDFTKRKSKRGKWGRWRVPYCRPCASKRTSKYVAAMTPKQRAEHNRYQREYQRKKSLANQIIRASRR